jgi:hypothetical protein
VLALDVLHERGDVRKPRAASRTRLVSAAAVSPDRPGGVLRLGVRDERGEVRERAPALNAHLPLPFAYTPDFETRRFTGTGA